MSQGWNRWYDLLFGRHWFLFCLWPFIAFQKHVFFSSRMIFKLCHPSMYKLNSLILFSTNSWFVSPTILPPGKVSFRLPCCAPAMACRTMAPRLFHSSPCDFMLWPHGPVLGLSTVHNFIHY